MLLGLLNIEGGVWKTTKPLEMVSGYLMRWYELAMLARSESSQLGPNIVCVFPEPVCPYAKIVLLTPLSTVCI